MVLKNRKLSPKSSTYRCDTPYYINQSIAGLDEDITGIKDIMERKPSGNTKYRSIGESIILGAASAALTGDRNRPNIPQLVKHPSQLQHSVWILIFKVQVFY